MTDASHGLAAAVSEEELNRLRDVLERAVAQVCPAWLNECREDLVQMALVKILESKSRRVQEGDVSASYLWKVAYSSLVDEIRRFQARRETPLEGDESEANETRALQPSPEGVFAAWELGEAIRQCLADMLRPRRQAVALYLQGHTVPAAAGILGWTSKKTENLVYRGLADLRSCLRAKGLEP